MSPLRPLFLAYVPFKSPFKISMSLLCPLVLKQCPFCVPLTGDLVYIICWCWDPSKVTWVYQDWRNFFGDSYAKFWIFPTAYFIEDTSNLRMICGLCDLIVVSSLGSINYISRLEYLSKASSKTCGLAIVNWFGSILSSRILHSSFAFFNQATLPMYSISLKVFHFDLR